ncbi:D-aspartate oxidase-like [Ruditapes philippinarum]|uniref:D-aspartate oxidase-like n=1 Tax=Ruditapes philippinarum TaxID=129788 RepID=UPI00295B7D67|nr:D-aspartate oxidase-like [Ruditapes philippinarum]
MVKVCVIGAGVIGLSSALRIIELHPDAEVIVIADKFSPVTTTDVSGGFWEPHLLGDTPEEKIRQWSGRTLEHMTLLANTDCAKYTGASVVSGYQMSADPNTKAPFWTDLVSNFRVLTQDELKDYKDMKFGFFYTTVMLEPQMYLQWLMKRYSVKSLFIRILLWLESYIRFILFAQARAPWIKEFGIFVLQDGLAYILPSSSYVVMGGVEYRGDWNTEVSSKDKKLIWENCTKYVPSLTEAVIDSDCVGLRPSRPSVRLELETVNLKGKIMPIIHNYGHGGAGVTLHWGCAEEVAHLVTGIIKMDSSTLKGKTILSKM